MSYARTHTGDRLHLGVGVGRKGCPDVDENSRLPMSTVGLSSPSPTDEESVRFPLTNKTDQGPVTTDLQLCFKELAQVLKSGIVLNGLTMNVCITVKWNCKIVDREFLFLPGDELVLRY